MAWIVQEPVIQIVNRVRIVVVEVEALADQQTSGFGKVRVRREAGVWMANDDARAGLATAEERPGVDDVGLLEAPLEIVGRLGMVATAAQGQPLVNVRDIVLEEGFGVDDFGLRAEAIHRVPRGAGRQSLPPRWRHELELAFRDGHQLDLPPYEACAFGHTIDDTRQLVPWASVSIA